MSLVREFTYMLVTEVQLKPKKTKTYLVRNKKHGSRLGFVLWSGPWRQYIFRTDPAVIDLSSGCLADLKTFIDEINDEHVEEVNRRHREDMSKKYSPSNL